jgi:FkbM family methyltransferase
MLIQYFREGTDDTSWVIPELMHADMYRMETLTSALRGVDGVILDCGAHIGVFSVLLANHAVSQPIEAFEPEPENYQLLLKNSQGFPSIRPIEAAIGTADEEGLLYRGQGTGRWSFCPREAREAVQVPVINLYRLIRESKSVALLKLDLEGYEAEILNRMPLDVYERIYMLIVEEHHIPIDHARIRAAGFSCWFHPLGIPSHWVYRAARLNETTDGKSIARCNSNT